MEKFFGKLSFVAQLFRFIKVYILSDWLQENQATIPFAFSPVVLQKGVFTGRQVKTEEVFFGGFISTLYTHGVNLTGCIMVEDDLLREATAAEAQALRELKELNKAINKTTERR